jgi:hypothetical protein
LASSRILTVFRRRSLTFSTARSILAHNSSPTILNSTIARPSGANFTLQQFKILLQLFWQSNIADQFINNGKQEGLKEGEIHLLQTLQEILGMPVSDGATLKFSRGDAPGYGDYGRWPIGVPVTCGQSANGNGSKPPCYTFLAVWLKPKS